MKAALVVNRMKSSMRENLNDIWNYIKKASQANNDLVIFPEAAITLGVNYLDEYYFGGAFSVDKEGRLISYFEIGQEGMLIINV